jgi:hypothetical protein
MDWVVEVAADLATGVLPPPAAAAAFASFDQHGCVLLRGAFAPATIEAMHRDYVAQLGALDLAAMRAEAEKPPPNRFLSTGEARFDIALSMTGAFGTPDLFANPLLLTFLRRFLGRDLRLGSLTLAVAHPGAPQQSAHRGRAHLFDEPGVGASLPAHAVNVLVPLVDTDSGTGPVGVWLGSHRQDSPDAPERPGPDRQAAWRRGDCLLLDCRTLHAEFSNPSARPRPIVSMVYARPWFFGSSTHVNRVTLDMPIEQYEALPRSVRPLLVRAYSNVIRARWHDVEGRA